MRVRRASRPHVRTPGDTDMFEQCGTTTPPHIERIIDQAGGIDLGRTTIAFAVLFQHGLHGVVLGLVASASVICLLYTSDAADEATIV